MSQILCRGSSWLLAAAAASLVPHTTTISTPAGIQGEPDQKRERNWAKSIVWMREPTLVNTESLSTRIRESKNQFKMEKVEGNVKASVSGEPSSTPSAVSHCHFAGTAETAKCKMAAPLYRPENTSSGHISCRDLQENRNCNQINLSFTSL